MERAESDLRSGLSSPAAVPPPAKCARCGDAFSVPPVPTFPGVGSVDVAGDERPAAGGAVSTVPSVGVDDWRRFTPSVLDPRLCMARTWGAGRGAQCRTQPLGDRAAAGWPRDLCASHGKQQQLAHGRVDGPIPAKKLSEFVREAAKRHAASASMEGSQGVSTTSGEGGGSAPLADPVSKSTARPARGPTTRHGIVSGFGAERSEDIVGDRRRLDAEAVVRGTRRRDNGERGRARDHQDSDLDRGAGGPWHAGRR